MENINLLTDETLIYSKNIKALGNYDFVVCGGGFAGFAAAYSAAREGLKVILIERNSSLGGVGTNGLVNQILGQRHLEDGKIKICVEGLFSKLEDNLLKANGAIDFKTVDTTLPPHGWFPGMSTGLVFDNETMKLSLEQMLCEIGVKILYMTDIIDVVKENNKISGVIVHNKSGLYCVSGKYFADATGDADVCAMAELEFFKGDQENGMAAASLEMHLENVDWEELTEYMRSTGDVRFKKIIQVLKEEGIWKFPYEIFISVMLTQKDTFMINTIRQVGIDGTDAESLSFGIIDGRKENFEIFEIAKKHFPGFKNATIKEIAPTIGIRETRRIAGEYTLTVEDLICGKVFDDSIALSGYGWDLPDPKRPSYQPSSNIKRPSHFTEIPYRCLLPVGIDNIITVGRCISVEREVLGPVRVMGPCIAMGEAAGIATALALNENTAYKQVDTNILRKKITENNGIVSRTQVKELEI